MKVISSSPGKVILFGEHFVVKGRLAVASAVNLRTNVSIEPKTSWPSIIKSEQLNTFIEIDRNLNFKGDKRLSYLIKAIELVKNRGNSIRPFLAKIYGELPVAVGLGSSASSSAAFLSALLAFHNDNVGKDDLFILTNEVEKLIHGKPSGIDSAVVVYGGTIAFRKGEKPRFINLRWKKGYSFVIACSRMKKSTGEVVKSVLDLAERHWNIFKYIYDIAEEISKRAIEAIERGDLESLGIYMNIAQGLLYSINVSNLELEKLAFLLRSLGCLGAKITGAGRGGCVISICKDLDSIPNALKNLSSKVFITTLGALGTTVKTLFD